MSQELADAVSAMQQAAARILDTNKYSPHTTCDDVRTCAYAGTWGSSVRLCPVGCTKRIARMRKIVEAAGPLREAIDKADAIASERPHSHE